MYWFSTLEDILCWTTTILDSCRTPNLKKFYNDLRQNAMADYFDDADPYPTYRKYLVSSWFCDAHKYSLKTDGEY